MMLGRLLELAGDETLVLVVSNHGYQAEARRSLEPPQTELERMGQHRREGIAVIRSPGGRRVTLAQELRAVDIAPTLLTLFGLQSPAEMKGRALNLPFRAISRSGKAEEDSNSTAPSERTSLSEPIAGRKKIDPLLSYDRLDIRSKSIVTRALRPSVSTPTHGTLKRWH